MTNTVAKDKAQAQKVLQLTNELIALLRGNIAQSKMYSLEAAYHLVASEATVDRPGVQADEISGWKHAKAFDVFAKEILHSRIQKKWNVVYQFLYNRIGKDVQNLFQEKKTIEDAWDEYRVKNDFKVFFSMSQMVKKHPDDVLNQPCPSDMKMLCYTGNSGWGKQGAVPVTESMTYIDLWQIADELVQNSGDLHHIFLENLIPMGDGKYSLSLGS